MTRRWGEPSGRGRNLPWLLAALGCAAPPSPWPRSNAIAPSAMPASAPAPTRSPQDRLMAQLVEARNIRWTRRLREDLQHLDELDADAPCSWKAILESRVAVAFRLAGGVPPFGYSHGGAFAAQLAKDRPKLFHVTRDAGAIVAHAWAPPNDVLFYPAAPLVLAGFVDLHSGARLRLSRASETTARFSYELATTDVAVWPTHVTEPAPCSQASLLDRHFEADPSDGQSDDVALLAASSSLPLTLTPTGPPVARLTVQS